MKKAKKFQTILHSKRIPLYSTHLIPYNKDDEFFDNQTILRIAKRKIAMQHKYTKKDLCVMIAKLHLSSMNKHIQLDYENMFFEIEAALKQNGMDFCYNENARALSHLFTIKEIKK